MRAEQASLFATDEEAQAPAAAMVAGEVSDAEILAAVGRLRFWCGPHGWRAPQAIMNGERATVVLHQGRLRAALLLDLGPAPIRRHPPQPA